MRRIWRNALTVGLIAAHCTIGTAYSEQGDAKTTGAQIWNLVKTSSIYADANKGIRIEHKSAVRALGGRELTIVGIVGWRDPEQPNHYALIGPWDYTGCPCDLGDPMKVIDVYSTHPGPEMGIMVQATGRFALADEFDGNGWIFRVVDAGPFVARY